MQYLLGHSTPVMVRQYSATYSSEEAVVHHAQFSPVGRLDLRASDIARAFKVEHDKMYSTSAVA